ncbi:MAG: hypothetical protein HY812_10970 [Planctomycetes bacterium]|nr:hypothetical protein [Planctomycetota bacterium]
MNGSWMRRFCLGGTLLGLAACNTLGGGGDKPAAPAAAAAEEDAGGGNDKEDSAAKRAEMEQKLSIARRKLEKAEMDVADQETDAADRLRQAAEELELAKAKLLQYETLDLPARLAEARLSLRSVKDRAQEAAEELAQIELMYEAQDLDDKTSEYVIARGRRNAERMTESVAIQERETESLEKHTLPQELRKLKLDVDRKETALAKTMRDAKGEALSREIGLMGARAELAKLEQDLKDLDAKKEKKSRKERKEQEE